MRTTPRSIIIITKAHGIKAGPLGREIALWLKERGVEAHVAEHDNSASELMGLVDGSEPPLCLVLGGDGTFISVARRTLGTGMPVLGLDLGRVGFLAELSQRNWQDSLDAILESGMEVRPRMAMQFEVIRSGKVIHSGSVVNDLVVSRGALARLVSLELLFGGERISNLRSDGFIVSTPSGSTAYCASAGGPVVHPDIQAFSVAPICPFLNNFRPLVVPGEMEIVINVAEASGTISLTEDGQEFSDLNQGDVLRIVRSEHDLLVGVCGLTSYFQKLKDKGFITER